MRDAVLLGGLQGICEWLPISSEGVVAALYGLLAGGDAGDALRYALWLHMGTAISAAIAFRGTLFGLARDAARSPKDPPDLLRFLIVATATSAVVGFPILLTAAVLSEGIGAAGMAIVGALMLVTGIVQLRRPSGDARRGGMEAATMRDALAAGLAQGLAALPGLSRSGLTVAMLLARRVDREDALRLSFLMSVPASVGAGIYAGASGGLLTSGGGLAALAVAAVVGLACIKALLRVAARLNFGGFALALGAAMLAGAAWQALG